mmetsp:Transcript_1278/g.2829  ORF Transcript_1278/g.2829 Transcript_1278/m.2829 type:complete len:196 (-) Transcript_1278:34-621(-)
MAPTTLLATCFGGACRTSMTTSMTMSSCSWQCLHMHTRLPFFVSRAFLVPGGYLKTSRFSSSSSSSEDSITFDASDDIVEETIEKSLRKPTKEEQDANRPAALLTTRREAIHLYRFVWRCSRLFVHTKEDTGEVWRDVLRKSAREEFEAARHETDPEIVTRLLVAGRDYCEQAVRQFMEKRDAIQRDEDNKKDKV